jgi:hypothetical protein
MNNCCNSFVLNIPSSRELGLSPSNLSNMTVQGFAKQIEYLLWTGAIQGKQILNLHHLLLSYQHKLLDAQEMQKAIDKYNPD